MKSLLITLDLYYTILEKRSEDEALKWATDDIKALATITLSVRPTELIHIKNCAPAKSAWDRLSSLYKADTASRKVNLFKKLVRFKVNSSEKFSPQINEFCCTVDDLKEIGITLNDDLLSILLLWVFNNSNSNRSVNNVKQVQPKYNHQEKKNTNVNAYNNNIKCFRCGKKGHIRSQCRESEKRDNDYACSLNDGKLNLKELWIVDSGATSHMCRTKEYFKR